MTDALMCCCDRASLQGHDESFYDDESAGLQQKEPQDHGKQGDSRGQRFIDAKYKIVQEFVRKPLIDSCFGNQLIAGCAQKPSATFLEENVAWEKFTSS